MHGDKISFETNILKLAKMNAKTTNTFRASIALLVSMVTAYTFIYLTKNCFSSAMVFIVEEGILTKFETGTINAVFYAVYAVCQMAVSPIVDRYKPERFITIGLLGAASANLVIYLNQNYVLILCVWVFNAIVQCAVWPAVFKIATTVICDRLVDQSIFYINAAGTLGTILSFVVAAIVSSHWQLNFLISAIGLVFFAVVWEVSCVFLRPLLDAAPKPEKKEKTETKSEKKKSLSFVTLLFSTGLLLLFIIAILRIAFDTGFKALTPSIINETYDEVSARLSTLVNIVVIAAGFFGMLFAGVLHSRFVRNEAVAILVLSIASMPFVCLLLLVGKVHYLVIVGLLAIMSFLSSTIGMFAMSYIAGRFNRFNMGATVVGLLNGGAAFGMVAANLIFTAIADNFGWTVTIISWICVMAAVALLSIVFLFIWTRFLKKIRKGEIYAENN